MNQMPFKIGSAVSVIAAGVTLAIALGCQQPAGAVEVSPSPATRPSVSLEDVPVLSPPKVQPVPQTRPAEEVFTVTDVKGIAQVRNSDEEPWTKVTVGMVLGAESRIRTGPRSTVNLSTAAGRAVFIDRLGTITLKAAVAGNDRSKNLKYGVTDYQIGPSLSGEEHEARIRTPTVIVSTRCRMTFKPELLYEPQKAATPPRPVESGVGWFVACAGWFLHPW